jgi:hypothetical protein
MCWYLDNAAKRTRWLGRIDPGDTLEQDLIKIKNLYAAAGFSIPLDNLVS